MAALELFANKGYDATSTSKIAKLAGVSEGLIFKHFESKKDLLNALMKDAESKLAEVWWEVMEEENPREVIRKSINLPFKEVDPSEHDFWRLQFKLKWDNEYHNPNKMNPLVDKITAAFEALNYPEPEKESSILVHLIEAISIEIVRGDAASQKPLQQFLLDKYK